MRDRYWAREEGNGKRRRGSRTVKINCFYLAMGFSLGKGGKTVNVK